MFYTIRTSHLTKSFNGIEVVSDVNLNIKNGEIYGILGPNGSGKTTVMKMLVNLIKPTSGEIEIFGDIISSSSYEYLEKVGNIIETPILYDELTAKENLEIHCKYMNFNDMDAIDDTLELVNLRNTGNKAVKNFSLGMKQRLGIARSIITNPKLLILDEPINGLDPSGIREIRNILKMMSKAYGTTILISSHILGEIEHLADTIGVLHNGKLIEEIGLDTIREKKPDYIEIVTKDSTYTTEILENELHITNFKLIGKSVIHIYDSHVPQKEIAKRLIISDIEIESIHKKTESLENYYLNLIKGESTDVKTNQTRKKQIQI
ncbi:ATP-binding cassette domain-containing protein [Bacillus solimangrovi]|uniref:Bacitracin ABC transporter ATP-binding protein n=1 Tax=Bacillus solimangrovi TaxID=1305675 RepID=A0A1E5LK55_9BACI|nr:ATP-binding cassette domain-containing protein [Bacillus solimangrovi]OEH94416.1 bacitracin ABC transporter ATP-binding protein [Bacillus solimangrovi]